MKQFVTYPLYWYVGAALTLGLLGGVGVEQTTAQVSAGPLPGAVPPGPAVTSYIVPRQLVPVDYVQAQSMRLPLALNRYAVGAQADLLTAVASQTTLVGDSDSTPGAPGTGETQPVHLGVPFPEPEDMEKVRPEEFGTSNHPFSTARADLNGLPTNTVYPYRASGKLFFKIGTSTFVCTASLIRRGLVVTAAHCVANFGQQQFYAGWQFVPGYRDGVAPFGVWAAQQAFVLTSYLNGTDACFQAGVICQDDVAILLLTPSATGDYPGTTAGWYGVGWNNFGFTANGLTQITQIGYPNCLNGGALMERNDSYGFLAASLANNTIIGSLMCGGSSGGPWLINFGVRPILTSTTAGTAPNPNLVVGVTSWGYNDPGLKEQGASPFTSDNLIPLFNAACAATPAACS